MIDLSNIPKNPGCYLFKSSSGIILYIGKAKNGEIEEVFKLKVDAEGNVSKPKIRVGSKIRVIDGIMNGYEGNVTDFTSAGVKACISAGGKQFYWIINDLDFVVEEF